MRHLLFLVVSIAGARDQATASVFCDDNPVQPLGEGGQPFLHFRADAVADQQLINLLDTGDAETATRAKLLVAGDDQRGSTDLQHRLLERTFLCIDAPDAGLRIDRADTGDADIGLQFGQLLQGNGADGAATARIDPATDHHHLGGLRTRQGIGNGR